MCGHLLSVFNAASADVPCGSPLSRPDTIVDSEGLSRRDNGNTASSDELVAIVLISNTCASAALGAGCDPFKL